MFENSSQGSSEWYVTFRSKYTGQELRNPMGPYPLPIAERVASSERNRQLDTTMVQVERA